MRKRLFSIAIFGAMLVPPALSIAQPRNFARIDTGGIVVSDIRMSELPGEMTLQMTLDIAPDAVSSTQGIAVALTIAGAGYEASFPGVLINGRNRARIYERQVKLGYIDTDEAPPFRVITIDGKGPATRVDYSAHIEPQRWMEGASMHLVYELFSPGGERRSYIIPVGGISTTTTATTTPATTPATTPTTITSTTPATPATTPATTSTGDFANNVVVEKPATQTSTPTTTTSTTPATQIPTPTPTPTTTPPATATTPAAQPPTQGAGAVQTVSGSANLDFETGASMLVPSFGHNRQELDEIDRVFSRISATPGARIVSVTVTGYSSPEGRYDANATLALNRARALARYLQSRYDLPSDVFKARAEGEDWGGLRAGVADDDSYPSEVMLIIDSADPLDAKESRLRRLGGGRVWQQMEREIFPDLRRVDYSIDFR